MENTKRKAEKNRGMVMIVLVLFVVWGIEPGFGMAAQVCLYMIENFFGAAPRGY